MTNFLIGCDPEVFMVNKGKLVSAHGAIPGTKKEPYKVNKGAVQVDGMALEFNIDPAKNAEEFVTNLTTVMSELKKMIGKYDILPTPVAEFGAAYIKKQPAEAVELGCDPDFNAWDNGRANPRPNVDAPFRTGAGHVHIGWGEDIDIKDPDHLEACIMATKQLDYYLGLPSLLFDDGYKRRELYGAPGAFRPKSYGVEYRVLSNAWLKSEALMKWVFDTTQLALTRLVDGNAAFNKHGDIICGYLKKKAPNKAHIAYYMQQNDIPLPPGFKYVNKDNWASGIVAI